MNERMNSFSLPLALAPQSPILLFDYELQLFFPMPADLPPPTGVLLTSSHSASLQ